MKQPFASFLLLISYAISSQAQVVAEVSNRSFPFIQPGMATISSVVFSSPTPANLVRIQTDNPRFQNVLTLKGKGHVKSVYWPGRSDQPLVFLIPGIGGVSDRGNVSDLAKTFQSWGYNVITVNNPMSWQFALTLIPDGAPGYFPEDSEILYSHMLSVKNQLEKKYALHYSKAVIASFSLGCQYAVELLKIDDRRKEFNFTESVMINPPLNIGYALHKYDQLNKIGQQIVDKGTGPRLTTYQTLRGSLISLFVRMVGLPPATAFAIFKNEYSLTPEEGEVMIGGAFKESVGEILYVTSLIHPKRSAYFKSPISESRREARYEEISKISFEDYFKTFILEKISVRSQFSDSQDLLSSFSLRKKMDLLQADPRNKFVLVKDDPISSSEDITAFTQAFGDRALVLNHGGHSGFYWFPGFAADLKSFLKP